MPHQGDVRAAPVPGCVDGWMALHERLGRLPLDQVLAPAIGYAEEGFPASPLLAMACMILPADHPLAAVKHAGQRVRRPGVGAALRAVASQGRTGFYEGEFGRSLVRLGGGEYTEADLGQPLADWVEPLAVDVWDHRVWTIPPNSQGYLTLLGAAIAAGLPLPDDAGDAAWAHLLIESARVAGHDRDAVLYEGADVRPLLDSAEVSRRRALADVERRGLLGVAAGGGDTTYLCTVDGDGMGVSLIQSNASGFGCMVFEPETGIGLHNRGIGFTLTPGHPAEYGPGRRPPHTLSPALVTRGDGSLRAVIGTMGGDGQPQILLQLLTRLLHLGQDPATTIHGPRWVLTPVTPSTGFDTWVDADATRVDVEDERWVDGLTARGHQVKVIKGINPPFGHAHLIEVDGNGMRGGASDPRAEVSAVVGM